MTAIAPVPGESAEPSAPDVHTTAVKVADLERPVRGYIDAVIRPAEPASPSPGP